MVKKYTELELAYFAGLFDGEGSISLHRKSSGTYSAHFTLGNTDKSIIEWILDKFDGYACVSTKKGNRTSCGYASKDCYTWELNIVGVKKLLPDLIPYLKIKKSQAIVMLDYVNKRRTNFTIRSGYPSWYIKWQDEVCAKLKELKSSSYSDVLIKLHDSSESLSDFCAGDRYD